MKIKNNYCIDCERIIDKRAKRCPKCYHSHMTGNNNPRFKKGIYCKKHYCKDCHIKEISIATVKYGNGRCKSCGMRFRYKNPKNHPMYGRTGSLNPMFGVHRYGEAAPTWIDGRSYEPYSPKFTEELKEQIRKRDDYKCQNCGMTEEEHLIVKGQVLHIHHIDYNKQNCKNNNLISACQQCNLRANFNREYWKNFYKTKLVNCDK